MEWLASLRAALAECTYADTLLHPVLCRLLLGWSRGGGMRLCLRRQVDGWHLRSVLLLRA